MSSRNRLRVLAIGTGTCSHAHPEAGLRRPPAFLVIADGEHVLLDCGEGTRFGLTALGIDYRLVTHVAITHNHPDHSVLPPFIQSKYCADLFTRDEQQPSEVNRLTVYMPKPFLEGSETLRIPSFMDVWRWHVPESPEFWSDFQPRLVGLVEGDIYVGPHEAFELHAFNVHHGFGKHPAMGMRVVTPLGVVGYTGDCGYTDDLARSFGGQVDLLIADCSSRIGQDNTQYGHMNPAECGRLARSVGAKTLWLTHYTGKDRDTAMIEGARRSGFEGDVVVAQDGEEWERDRS